MPDADAQVPGQVTLKALLLADNGQLVAGKLYLLGAGFDRIYIGDGSAQALVQFVVALQLEIPWSEERRTVLITGALCDADGQPLGFEAELHLDAPPGAGTPGTPSMFPALFPLQAVLPGPGRYVVEIRHEGQPLGRTGFTASADPFGMA